MLLSIGGIGYYTAYTRTQEMYDNELSHVANLMLSLLQAEDAEEVKHGRRDDDDEGVNPDIIELGNDFEKTDARHDRRLAFRIWRRDRLLFYSREASNFGVERKEVGFASQRIDGKKWRIYTVSNTIGGYTLEVAQPSRIRSILIEKTVAATFLPLTFLLPVIILVVWGGLRWGMKPLVDLSEAVSKRSEFDLTPLTINQPLREISPLVQAINGLLANLGYALQKERRFTDLAAHELRTPIAVLKTQAQTALKATDETERRSILEAQVLATDRATKMLEQLLTLARLEHVDVPRENVSLADVVKHIVEERLSAANAKQIKLHLEIQEKLSVLANQDLLAIALGNLVDNAIKYTPENGEINVKISKENNAPRIVVEDNGPGISEDKLLLVTERFYRIPGTKQPGAGLGLAIVKRAAELLGAEFTLKNKKPHGLQVVMRFSGQA